MSAQSNYDPLKATEAHLPTGVLEAAKHGERSGRPGPGRLASAQDRYALKSWQLEAKRKKHEKLEAALFAAALACEEGRKSVAEAEDECSAEAQVLEARASVAASLPTQPPDVPDSLVAELHRMSKVTSATECALAKGTSTWRRAAAQEQLPTGGSLIAFGSSHLDSSEDPVALDPIETPCGDDTWMELQGCTLICLMVCFWKKLPCSVFLFALCRVRVFFEKYVSVDVRASHTSTQR